MPAKYDSVNDFLAAQPAERRAEVEAIRRIVLGAHPDVFEHVKWNSPSYVFEGDDRLTVAAHAKDAVRLILHAGATTPEDKKAKPTFAGDPLGLLEWHSNIRASLAFRSLDEIEAKADDVSAIVRNWLDDIS